MRIFHSERLKRRDRRAIPSIFGVIARRDHSNKNYSFQIVDGPADYLAPCADGRGENLKGQTAVVVQVAALPAFPRQHHHPGYLRAALRLISPLSLRYIKPARARVWFGPRAISSKEPNTANTTSSAKQIINLS